MKSPKPFRRIAVVLALASIGLCVLPAVTRAQATRDYQRDFGAVMEWQLTFTVTNQGSGSHTDAGLFETPWTWNINESVTGTITLICDNSIVGCTCPQTLSKDSCAPGTAVVTANIDDISTDPSGTTTRFFGSGSYTPRSTDIFYRFTDNTYSISVDGLQPSGVETIDGQVVGNNVGWVPACGGGGTLTPFDFGDAAANFSVPFPASGLTLTHTGSAHGGFCADPLENTLNLTASIYQVSWTLTPIVDVDLQVSIPQYETWRPTAGRAESDAKADPNLLLVNTQLVSKTTGLFVMQPPEQLTFTLTGVSREPGVAMNWPPASGAPSSPDISIESQTCVQGHCVPINQGFTITDGTKAEMTDPFSTFSSIQLSPHDWGGWATLNVDAVVAGTTIHGHLQLAPPAISDPDATDIRLPKRQADSVVADSWKVAHGVALDTPDNDDSEDTPKNADGHKGDGFTLYEEYRGFYMGCAGNSAQPQPEIAPGATPTCQHVEGDPAAKDLFVEEEIPVDRGILLFQDDTGLKVHFIGLTRAEMGPQGPSYRVMNFNHAAGPYEVDQHGLVIQRVASNPNPPDSGGYELSRAVPIAGLQGRGAHLPRETDYIEIVSRFNSIQDFAKTVAHELGHAVGIYHHGDLDTGVATWHVDPNTGGIVEITNAGLSTPITVRTETGIPVLLSTIGLKPNSTKTVKIWVGNIVCGLGGTVAEHGPHSGDVASFMRYDVAGAYIPANAPNIRYWVEGTEPTGLDLTNHPGGTGVNGPPLSRYGDAFTGRGNDLSQIDVNDIHSTVIKALQTCQ